MGPTQFEGRVGPTQFEGRGAELVVKSPKPRQMENRKPLEENARVVLRRIADERVVLVVYALAGGALRFGELNRAITGLSQKLLIKTVRALEKDGLIHREVFHQVPPRVEYSLTVLGKKLRRPVSGLCKWAVEHAAD